MDKSMELGSGEKALTISALNSAINQMQIQRKTISIKEETAITKPFGILIAAITKERKELW